MKLAGAILLALLLAGAPSAGAGRDKKLPPTATHGPANRLQQYPAVSLATPVQRAAARELWERARTSTRRWRDSAQARRDDYEFRRSRRKPGTTSTPLWLHAENALVRRDEVYVDPIHPDTLIYADVPGQKLVLIGVMFSMPRGKRGATPGGPITRWHSHYVCARGNARGVAPRRDGTCPRGTKRILGSEMLHVWFTRDLRSAYAIHAPVPELCAARLIPGRYCRERGHGHGH